MARPQYKIVVLGDVAGKSSLLLRFTHDTFRHDACDATIGVDFTRKEVRVNNKTLVLQLWQTGSASCNPWRHETKSLTLNFMKGADVVLIVYDVTSTRSFDFAKRWVDIIQKIPGPSALLALVANKVDLQAAVSTEEAQQFCQERNMIFAQTSAKTGENVSALFVQISEQLRGRSPVRPEPLVGPDFNADVEGQQVAAFPRPRRCCFFPNLF